MSKGTSPKISKLLWLLFMIAMMVIYLLIISRLIDAFFAGNIVLEIISYSIAGIVWIFPAKWIMFKINGTDQPGNK
jgi:hypothetical protein